MGDLFNLAIFPPLLKQFVMTMALSFIIGLELHSYRRSNSQDLIKGAVIKGAGYII